MRPVAVLPSSAELAELGAVLVEGVEEVAGFVVAGLEADGDDVQRVLRVVGEAGAHHLPDGARDAAEVLIERLGELMTSPVMPFSRLLEASLRIPSMSVTTDLIAPLTSSRLSP
jgi:hypothetical protein